jgi:hypothetical protein
MLMYRSLRAYTVSLSLRVVLTCSLEAATQSRRAGQLCRYCCPRGRENFTHCRLVFVSVTPRPTVTLNTIGGTVYYSRPS